MLHRSFLLLTISVVILHGCSDRSNADDPSFDVVIVGGGASGVMAGIQAARLGAKTLIIEEYDWLGGMMTSAGVSAIDGNYELHSGLWEEFRQLLNEYYGGPDSLKTGWVSNVLFEPQVGAKILQDMATKEGNLTIYFRSSLVDIQNQNNRWKLQITKGDEIISLDSRIVIDATELGDVAKLVGIPYSIGMDSRSATGEEIAPKIANNIVQDLTYVVILEEFYDGKDHTIPKPKGFDPTPFLCTCEGICSQEDESRKLWDCDEMMRYGRLPKNKVMINWPINGNDFYANAIDQSPEARNALFEQAKWYTLCYVYYLQTHLGYSNFGIAEGVFPTEDHFPMIPYHRESRRIEGKVTFNINDLARPYDQNHPLYKTGIAVGDYPVDHHHRAYPDHEELPDLHFYPVPSYTLPLGTLLPKEIDNFIVAEKSISVTNIVNGTTRLQPVCMLLGQAAGVIAGLSVRDDRPTSDVSIRAVQSVLLQNKAYILPYSDVDVTDPAWASIQRIGATGILKGEGKNIGWRNHTLFHPEQSISEDSLLSGLKEIYDVSIAGDVSPANPEFLNKLLKQVDDRIEISDSKWESFESTYQLSPFEKNRALSRREIAVLLDKLLNPFALEVDLNGELSSQRNE